MGELLIAYKQHKLDNDYHLALIWHHMMCAVVYVDELMIGQVFDEVHVSKN